VLNARKGTKRKFDIGISSEAAGEKKESVAWEEFLSAEESRETVD
jgi:hypothetical protein